LVSGILSFLIFDFWNLEFGIWDLEFGIWNLEFGIWNLEFLKKHAFKINEGKMYICSP
jgi:hypothetical protein